MQPLCRVVLLKELEAAHLERQKIEEPRLMIMILTVITILIWLRVEPMATRVGATIRRLPRLIYMRIKWWINGQLECAICLERLEDHIFMLKKCSHYFHYKCIRDWLYSQVKASCPLCRTLI